ncbi:hypothetical protein [Pseudomonas sp. MAG002Y]|uniref:hypothetical protein n=1 Tax=Pseudomonas sp. MAG002Y TaxID=2678690 RepID=UPI001C6092DD|nr:hypothetical protein [Pseudomonas sp. MAG002Y]MBW5414818.1 hypothetical protein [Pseudomonas sp. MAG002Y]
MPLPMADRQQDLLAVLLRRAPKAGYIALAVGDALDPARAPISDGYLLRDITTALFERWAKDPAGMTSTVQEHLEVWRDCGALSSASYESLIEKIKYR